MSDDVKVDDGPQCSTCGKRGAGLKRRDACEMAQYCNVHCQGRHHQWHKRECKRRAAELLDEALFARPTPRARIAPSASPPCPHDAGDLPAVLREEPLRQCMCPLTSLQLKISHERAFVCLTL
ncbi:hypothetical protein ACHAWF_005547 [Thalassiosira exigua]